MMCCKKHNEADNKANSDNAVQITVSDKKRLVKVVSKLNCDAN